MRWLDLQRWFGGRFPNLKSPDLPSVTVQMSTYWSQCMRCTTGFGAIEGAGTEVCIIIRKLERQWRLTGEKRLSRKCNGPEKPKSLQ